MNILINLPLKIHSRRKSALYGVLVAVAASVLSLATSSYGASVSVHKNSDHAKALRTFTFGELTFLTGFAAPIGVLQQEGAELAVSEINASGGAGGYKLNMITEDNGATALGGQEGMSKLIDVNHVHFVIEGGSASILGGLSLAQKNRVVVINMGGASTSLVGQRWLYNVAPNPGILDPPLVNYLWSDGVRNLALLLSQDTYGEGNGTVLAKLWKKKGGTVVSNQTTPTTTADFSALLQNVKNSGAQAMVATFLGQTQITLARQEGSAGLNILTASPLISVPSNTATVMNGFIGTNPYVNRSATGLAGKDFIRAWNSKYPSVPAESSEGEPFQAVEMLASTLTQLSKEKIIPTAQAIAKYMNSAPLFYNYMNGGSLRILKNHDDVQRISLDEVRSGTLATLKVVIPRYASS